MRKDGIVAHLSLLVSTWLRELLICLVEVLKVVPIYLMLFVELEAVAFSLQKYVGIVPVVTLIRNRSNMPPIIPKSISW